MNLDMGTLDPIYDVQNSATNDGKAIDVYLTLKDAPVVEPGECLMGALAMLRDIPGVAQTNRIDPNDKGMSSLLWCRPNRDFAIRLSQVKVVEASAVSSGSSSFLCINVFQVTPEGKPDSNFKWAVIQLYWYDGEALGLSISWHTQRDHAMSHYERFQENAKVRRERRLSESVAA